MKHILNLISIPIIKKMIWNPLSYPNKLVTLFTSSIEDNRAWIEFMLKEGSRHTNEFSQSQHVDQLNPPITIEQTGIISSSSPVPASSHNPHARPTSPGPDRPGNVPVESVHGSLGTFVKNRVITLI